MDQEYNGGISILTILYFSRWRPIWPPNHTKNISAEKHDRETNFVSINMYWTRNTMVAFSTLAKIYFSRWRPIWPPNHTKSHISAQNHNTNLMLLPILTKIWSGNLMVAFSTLAKIIFQDGGQYGRQITPVSSAVGSVGPQRYEKMCNFMTEMNIKVKLQVILGEIGILKSIKTI